MFPSSVSGHSISAKRRSIFKFSLANMADKDSPVLLTAFNGINGESSTNGLGEVLLVRNGDTAADSSATKQEIRGPTGTVRGFKNLIRYRKECLRHSTVSSNDEENDHGKIIVYTTSMGGIRATLQECRFIRNLFNNLALKVDERDIFMQREYQTELDDKTGAANSSVPQVFVNQVWLGGYKELEHLNETGQLKTLLADFERTNGTVCESCGGFRYVNCSQCNGSKNARKTRISREINILKCTACNENGMQRCPQCT